MSDTQSTTESFAAFPQALQDRLATQQTPQQQIKRRLPFPAAPTAFVVESGRPQTVSAPIPVQQPGFTNPSADPTAISVALPSEFYYYDFKDVYVKPFRAFHLAKLSKAHEDRSMLPMVEAVSSVLSTTSAVTDPIGFDLCVADFYFVLYWLKLHSFAKATLVNTSFCLNPDHIKQVQDGVMAEETLKIVTVVQKSELNIKHLTEVPAPDKYALPEPYFCRPATMRDTVEFLENPDWLDAEYAYLARLASSFTSKENRRMSLADKIEVVKSFDGDTCNLLHEFEEEMDKFGVEESITIKCNGCGASRVSKLTLDAHSFLSSER